MHSFCLSLYGASLWKASSLELQSLEIAYNNILRKIWRLPRHCHTSILHCVSSGSSVFNTVLGRSSQLVASSEKKGSNLLIDVFTDSPSLVYTSFGYNSVYYHRHRRNYRDCDKMCDAFIREARMCLQEPYHPIDGEINFMCIT